MVINIDQIMDKINQFVESDEGQDRAMERIEEYRQRGINQTAAGTEITGEKRVRDIGTAFRGVLRRVARSYNLPPSVIGSLDTIMDSMEIHRTPAPVGRRKYGNYAITFGFYNDTPELHRDSLMPEKYDGIDNIVALFNNGYNDGTLGGRSVYVRGMWHDEMVTAREVFDGYHFIEEAVSEFDRIYGKRYRATVILGPEYE